MYYRNGHVIRPIWFDIICMIECRTACVIFNVTQQYHPSNFGYRMIGSPIIYPIRLTITIPRKLAFISDGVTIPYLCLVNNFANCVWKVFMFNSIQGNMRYRNLSFSALTTLFQNKCFWINRQHPVHSRSLFSQLNHNFL